MVFALDRFHGSISMDRRTEPFTTMARKSTIKDITGKRFGKLVAIEATEKRRGSNVVWLFQCDCGRRIERDTKHLSDTSSCGCSNWNSLRRDITGQRFGRLVALYQSGRNQRGNILWRFQCDCGNAVDLTIGAVTSGNTLSCGCYRKEVNGRNNPSYKDLAGERFGMLKVQNEAGRRGGNTLWECRCDCGKIVYFTTVQLTHATKRSCGCVDNRLYCVYKHVFPDGKVYIGKTSRLPLSRWTSGYGYKGQTAIENEINSIGRERFLSDVSHFILGKDGTWQVWNREMKYEESNVFSSNQANSLEKQHINECHATDPLYGLNSASGGDRDFAFNDIAKQNNSKAKKEYLKTHTPNFKGMHHTDKTKKILSEKASKQMKENPSFKGRKHTEKTKELIGEKNRRHMLENNPFKGKHHSDETKELLRQKRQKRVTKYDLEGKRLESYESVSTAAEATGVKYTGISNCARGGTKQCAGFIWRYYDVPQLSLEQMPSKERIYKPGEKKQVQQLNKSGDLLAEFLSVAEASSKTGISPKSISACARGMNKTAGGFIWRYVSVASRETEVNAS